MLIYLNRVGTLVFAFTLLLSVPHLISAETEKPVRAIKQAGDIIVRIVMPFTLDDKLYYELAGNMIPAPLHPDSISGAIYVRGTRDFSLFQKQVDEEGEIIYVPVVTKHFSEGNSMLAILGRSDGEYILKTLDMSSVSMADHQVTFLNMTPLDLFVKIGQESQRVAAGKLFSVNFEDVDPVKGVVVSTMVGADWEDENRVICSDRTRLYPGCRMALVCFASRTLAERRDLPFELISHQTKLVSHQARE